MIGMGFAVVILNALLAQHIHFISLLFIVIIGALPVLCMDEAETMREWKKGLPFLLSGALLVAGAASVVKLIQAGLSHYRPQMIYFILGMMVTSIYAIVMGPTTLEVPQAPLSFSSFSLPACIIGAALVAGMQAVKIHGTKQSAASLSQEQ